VKPEPLVISWRRRQLRIRHDDPLLKPLQPTCFRYASGLGGING
jgi:hypothetical protein